MSAAMANTSSKTNSQYGIRLLQYLVPNNPVLLFPLYTACKGLISFSQVSMQANSHCPETHYVQTGRDVTRNKVMW